MHVKACDVSPVHNAPRGDAKSDPLTFLLSIFSSRVGTKKKMYRFIVIFVAAIRYRSIGNLNISIVLRGGLKMLEIRIPVFFASLFYFHHQCKKKHTLVCPDFVKTGSCPRRAQCKLQHHRGPKRARTKEPCKR